MTFVKLTLVLAMACVSVAAQSPPHKPDVMFLATEDAVVDAMLTLARVTRNDVVYDLGCGDGKILIAAAKKYGARGVGIDIDPKLIDAARDSAKRAGVAHLVQFRQADIFDPALKISDATVVTLFLLPSLNERLRPRLQGELKPGARVVSNSFSMGAAWPPQQTQEVPPFWLYLWKK